MIDHELIRVVRRLLDEAYESDRSALVLAVRLWAAVQLRRDPRCVHSGGTEDIHGIGSLVGSELVVPERDSSGRRTVPKLHSLLLYRTAYLGASPRLHSKVRNSLDANLFDASRKFLLGLGDGELYAALRGGVRTSIHQLAYRELSGLPWRRTKNNLRNLVLRTPELTLVRCGRRQYVAHSRFFGGAPQADAQALGRFPGRVLSVDLLDRLMRQARIDCKAFATTLAFWVNEEEPLLINLDALTTSRHLFVKSFCQAEAAWAGPDAVIEAAKWRGKPLFLVLLYISELIESEVPAALARYRPRRLKKTEERMEVWKEATIERLEAAFGIDDLSRTRRDWKMLLERRLDGLGVHRDRAAHYAVVHHVYGVVRKRVRYILASDGSH